MRRDRLANRFLWIIAGITIFIIVGGIAYRIFEQDLMRFTLVPKAEFQEVAMPKGVTYRDPDLWIARPDLPNNPAAWLPSGITPAEGEKRAAVFFIHPTSFLDTSAWNAPLDHTESQNRARLFVQSQASAFNHVGEIWAPKYRQATFGAFLTTEDNARRALDFAYRDVLAAFEVFMNEVPADRPIILAAHSQGSLHLLRLLQERVRRGREARRIVAAYVVGWPISMSADMPSLPLPACVEPNQARCVLSWQSFGEPADPKMVTDVYDASTGPNGVSRAGSPMLCVNPLNGVAGDMAGRSLNLGTLIPNADFTDATLRREALGARCDQRGFLLIGENPPEMGPYVLPGNNYHVYDYALFWGNIRADVTRRLAAFSR